MANEVKIEFGADFRRWLIAKILLTTLVLGSLGVFLYHKISSAAAEEAEKEHQRLVGIEGIPILVGANRDWFDNDKKLGTPEPGLKLTQIMTKGLDLRTDRVKRAEKRPLPPQIGTLNYDNEANLLIKCRFNGELVEVMQVKDKAFTNDAPYEKVIERPVKFGDKVQQGDVLAVFWSVTLGTAKAAFVDGISAVRLSQDAYQRQLKLYKDGGLPLGSLKAAERQLQGDNNNLLTCERTLRMWKMNTDEIEALRKEANDVLDAILIDPTGRITKIDDAGMTLLLSSEDKNGKAYKFAKGCKFSRVIKRDETEEIKGGPRADDFKNLGKKGIGASIVTNLDGEVTEVIIGKERDVLEEVNRWARTDVYVPWFDKANPDRELTLVEKNTSIGDIVDNTNFGTWLFRVADLGKLAIWVHPAEEHLPLIREGMKVHYAITEGALRELGKDLSEQRKGANDQKQVDEVMAKLDKLRSQKLDREFDHGEFVMALKNALGDNFAAFHRTILAHLKSRGGLTWEIRMQSDPQAPPLLLDVDLLCPAIEPNQHNPMLMGYLPNKDHKFLVGQFVTATLQMPPEDNTAEIPTSAINEYNGQSFVFLKGMNEGEYFIRRVAVVRRYAEYTVVRTASGGTGKLRPQDEAFSAYEVKQGRYPVRPLQIGDQVVVHGVVELTTSLETLLTKELITLQK
jgi:multidrug efflux pump subunit AcrA (membrane-fusion protein)